MRKHLKRIAIFGGVLVAGILVGTAATAVVTTRFGSIADQHYFQHDTNAAWYNSGAFTNVHNAVAFVRVPRGETRMIDARFAAESLCEGAAGYCSVRIIVTDRFGNQTELDPQSGFDFAFDTAASGDGWESHAIERTSDQLTSGRYRVRVQAAVVGGANRLRLDDWSLAVALINP